MVNILYFNNFKSTLPKMRDLERRRFLKQGVFATSFYIFKPILGLFGQTDGPTKPTWTQLVDVARWCPTVHNLQPHQLKVLSEDKAALYCDSARMLPVGDPQGIFVTIALGIFIEHLSIAASDFGYKVIVSEVHQPLDTKLSGSQLFAQLSLVQASEKEQIHSDLIYQRRTSRLHYDGLPLQQKVLDEIHQEAALFGHEFFYDHSEQRVNSIIELNQQTLFDDLNDEANRNELDRLFRYNDDDARKLKDGLWYKAMCFPGNLMRSVFQKHTKWNHGVRSQMLGNYYKNSFKGTRTIGWFVGNFETPSDWLNAGHMLARTWLLLSKHNAYLHPFGSLITNKQAYDKLIPMLEVNSDAKKVWMIFRAGYSKIPVRSFRLTTDQLILK